MVVPVARDLGDAAGVVGAAGLGIGGGGVDGPPSGQHDGIVVVVELAREEEGTREAVVLGPVVPVVLVSRDRVAPEAPILGDVERQQVAVPEEDRLTVADLHQLGRYCPVEGPHRQGSLIREARVEGGTKGRRGVDAGVEVRRDARAVGSVGLGAFRGHLDGDRGGKRAECLVSPDRPRRTALIGTRVARPHPLQPRVENVPLGFVNLGQWRRIQRRHRITGQHIEAGHGLSERLDVEQRAPRKAGRDCPVCARRERAQAVLEGQRPAGREDPHLDQVPA